MTDNPFEDMDVPLDLDDLLHMAEEIDGMERDVDSWEAEFLESILVRLRGGTMLTDRQASKLKEIYEKYLG